MLRLAQAQHGHIWHGSADEVIQKRSFAAIAHVRFWHKADMTTVFGDVCFRG
jgi:hypothetical protein